MKHCALGLLTLAAAAGAAYEIDLSKSLHLLLLLSLQSALPPVPASSRSATRECGAES